MLCLHSFDTDDGSDKYTFESISNFVAFKTETFNLATYDCAQHSRVTLQRREIFVE